MIRCSTDVNIVGDLNNFSKTLYSNVTGHFNSLNDCNLSTIFEGHGNTISNSGITDIKNTNNNNVKTSKIEVNGKDPDMKYYGYKGVIVAENNDEKTNLRMGENICKQSN